MMSNEPCPPRWAEAILRLVLRPSDRESISGDLLEEYRAAKWPAFGTLRANAWYLKHVLSMLWRLIQPCALVLAGLSLLSLMSLVKGKGLWYGSFVQAPGVSLLHALIYMWAGYHGSRRTGLIKTGMLTAGVTSFVGCTVLFAAAAIRDPSLLLAPLSKPFIFVILWVLLLLAVSYGVMIGTLGGIIGRWYAPRAPREVRVS